MTRAELEALIGRVLLGYSLVSLVVGFCIALRAVLERRPSQRAEAPLREAVLTPDVEQGHLQRETYDERVVYHPLDFWGRSSQDSVDTILAFRRRHPVVYDAVMVCVGTVVIAVSWPVDVWRWVARRLRGQQEHYG